MRSGIIERFKARIKEEGGIGSAAFAEFEKLFEAQLDICMVYVCVDILVIAMQTLRTRRRATGPSLSVFAR
jgi:hypothetical protein